MRGFLNGYLEIVHAGLTSPAELAGILKRTGGLNYYYYIGVFLTSVSFAVGQYLLRDSYHSYYWAELIVISVFMFLFINLWTLINGPLIDRIVSFFKKDRVSQAELTSDAVGFALIPFVFFSPGAGLIKNAEHQSLFLILLFLFLSGWSIYAGLRTLQYLYDISFRDSLKVFLISQSAVLLFPLLLLSFGFSFFLSLL